MSITRSRTEVTPICSGIDRTGNPCVNIITTARSKARKDETMPECLIKGCSKPARSKQQLCGGHYQRLIRHGSFVNKRELPITYDGKTMSVSAWAREIGMHRNTLLHRLRGLGWPVERALTTPPGGVSKLSNPHGDRRAGCRATLSKSNRVVVRPQLCNWCHEVDDHECGHVGRHQVASERHDGG